MADKIEGSVVQMFEGAHSFLSEDAEAVPALAAFLTR